MKITITQGIVQMKIFFDMEFTGLHQLTTPISIGLITEEGETFYAEFTDYSRSQVDDWIQKNVIDNLLFGSSDTSYPVGTKKVADKQSKAPVRNVFVNELKDWLYSLHDRDYPPKGKLEMWTDCLAYDWMLFCEPWGGALEIPEIIYYIPFDLATLFKTKGIDPDINREEFSEMYEIKSNGAKHNALWDAKVIKACYEKLEGMKR